MSLQEKVHLSYCDVYFNYIAFYKFVLQNILAIGKGRIRMSTTFSPNVTSESGEEINGTSVPEEETSDKNSQDVLVIPFGPTIEESVGLLSEQKVCTRVNIVYILLYFTYF